MLNKEYMDRYGIKNVDIFISYDMGKMCARVKFVHGVRMDFESHFFNPDFDRELKERIESTIVTRERRIKLRKIKKNMRYDYFRRLFKRTQHQIS